MSTNSLVAILNKDNTVTSSYVHWDGYATGVGEMLLENYNSEELSRELATTLGYASSLRETIAASHEDRSNSDEPETYEDYESFEEIIRDRSYLEYVYIWDCHENKWMVSSWETTKKKVHNGTCLDYEFDYHWNGFEDLVIVYCREGRETVKRYREMYKDSKVSEEYLTYADELETAIFNWRLTEDVIISEGLNV
jgi:hypothetical protein